MSRNSKSTINLFRLDYFNMTFRDIMENWQSEFLQLMWQVAGLSFLLYVGSPQSKESSERIEEKIDLIMKKLQERNSEQAEEGANSKIRKDNRAHAASILCYNLTPICFLSLNQT